jgi:hypothetical protein
MHVIPRTFDKANNHSKHFVTIIQHPKIKRGCTCNIRSKSFENIFLLGLSQHLKGLHSPLVVKMEIIMLTLMED